MHLFLSPHFDDAVLSSGGTIHQLAKAGESVIIATVMAGAPLIVPDTPIISALHARWGTTPDQTVALRQQEDRMACATINATPLHLSIPDCIYRLQSDGMPLYRTDEDIFGPVHPQDPAISLLRAISLPTDITALYLPMGIGHHVDHQLVRDWGLEWAEMHPTIDLFFYEDYPYTRSAQATAQTRARWTSGWTMRDIRLTEADIEAKIAGITCYRSQITSFWHDEAHLNDDVRAHLCVVGDGQAVERFWIKGAR